jgi:hypothetical protein
MKLYLGILLALLLSSCGDTSEEEVLVADPTASTPELLEYEDSDLVLSSDGLKAVFLSKRTDGRSRTFTFDSSRVDKVQAIEGTGEYEDSLVSLTSSGEWLAVIRYTQEKPSLLIRDWSASQTLSLALDGSDRVTSLALVSDSGALNGFLAYSTRSAQGTVTRVYKASSVGGVVSLSDEAVFQGEESAEFSDSKVLYTQKSLGTGREVRARQWSGGAWGIVGSEIRIRSYEAQRGFSSDIGFFYPKVLGEKLLRNKSGNRKFEGTIENAKVGVLDDLALYSPLSGVNLDTSAVSFRERQPLTVASISGTQDGSYFLLLGTDAYYCEGGSQQSFLVITLVRRSDMASIPLIVAKKSESEEWSMLISKPCDLLGANEVFYFDNSILKSSLKVTSDQEFLLSYETNSTGDRELNLMKFRIDWEKLEASNVNFVSISKNKRKS